MKQNIGETKLKQDLKISQFFLLETQKICTTEPHPGNLLEKFEQGTGTFLCT